MKHIKLLSNNELLLQNCIISYPHLFTARRAGRPGQETGEPKFSADFILPADLDEEDRSILSQSYATAMQAVFGAEPPANLRTPFKDATQTNPKFAGRYRIATSTAQDRPPDVFTQLGRMSPEQQTQLFAGCVVNAHIRFYGYTRGSNGVAAGLQGVMLVDNQNVERLDNRSDSASVFGVPGGFPTMAAPPPDQPAPAVPASQAVAPGVPQAPAAPAPGVPTLGPAGMMPPDFTG